MKTGCFAKVILATACSLVLTPAISRAQETHNGESVGVVSYLNLLSDKSEDISTLDAWKKTYIKDGMTEQDKAIAIFNTVVKYRHQANPPAEYLASSEAGGHVHDPLKTFHVYGYNQCCCASADVIGLSQYVGMPARGRDISRHSVSEISYNNAWHLVDGSVMNYHVKDNGEIASVDEINEAVTTWLKDHPDLVNDDKKLRAFAREKGWKKGPALLSKADRFYGEHGPNTAGWHGWSSTMQEYYEVQPQPTDFTTTMGYQLNVQLRPGEKITRNFFSRGIDYTNSCSAKYYGEMLDRRHLGIQGDMGDHAPGRVGDGTIEWTVPLTTANLADIALTAENLAPVGKGIGAADPSKPGVLILRFPSSYVYVKGLAMIDMSRGQGNIVASFSDNNGLDWKELMKQEAGGGRTMDLTTHIQRRYDYRIKFVITGPNTSLNELKTVSHFQCSQAALPVITEGENQIKFSAGPQEGTITTEGSTETKKAREMRQLTVGDFKPVISGGMSEDLHMTGASGDATFNLETPGEMTRLRISAVYRARDAKDGFEFQASYDGGKTFTPVKAGQLEGGTRGASRYIIVDDIPANTKSMQLRLAGTQAGEAFIKDLRIDADYKESTGGFKPVRITYEWMEGHQPKAHVHVAKSPSETYTINCGPGTVVRSFTMQLAE